MAAEPSQSNAPPTPTDLRFGALDIGGTKLAVGVTDAEGRVRGQSRAPTDTSLGPEAVCDRLLAMLREAHDEADAEIPLAGVGVGCGGPLDRATGRIITVPNMPGWDGFPLRAYLEERLGLPVALDNDANAAALGEALYGAGRGSSHVCYFTVSTGIGGGIVVNGSLYRGATELAGEFGHQVILPDGPRCPCGKNGCLEALASGTSIARRARERLAAGACSSVRMAGDSRFTSVTAARLADAARDGDPFALDLWEETGFYLGLGIVNVIHLLNPNVVVIGGGVASAGDLLFRPVRRTVRARGMAPLVDACRIVPAALGQDVGIVGAAALAMENSGE
ncbi:MAG: ROK family protein [Armatimonadetes bacterium]|nr:ROK family protein [Armatimonadota bacterium]